MATKENKMELDVSDKKGGFVKPLIRKGYYPAKVSSIEPVKDKEGNIAVNRFGGNDLIIKFMVWDADNKGNPTNPMKVDVTPEGVQAKMESDVELAMFISYTWKDEKSGDVVSAITPNSKITKTFTALGWVFDSEKKLETDSFVGAWAELNIDDYTKKAEDGSETKFSVVKGINKFEGKLPQIEEDIQKDKKSSKSSSKPDEKYKDGADDDLDLEELDVSDDFELSEEATTKIATLKEQVDAGLIDQEMFEKIKADIIKKESK